MKIVSWNVNYHRMLIDHKVELLEQMSFMARSTFLPSGRFN